MTYRTLIVDDESSACNLDNMLARIEAPFNIIGKAADGFDAIKLINDSKPDVVFLDTELPGINGIELLERCTFDPFIIFTTTHTQYAIKAFEAKTIAYLVKPVVEKRLVTAIIKLLKMTRMSPEPIASIPTPVSNKAAANLPLLPVKNGDVIFLIPMESIIWISAEGKYTIIATKEKQYVSSYTITELEKRLYLPSFLRVHRSYIVNLKHIVELRKNSSGKLKCITSVPPDENIYVSKNYYDNLKERLKIN